MKSNKIILLGGTGFVGRKLVSAILTQGHSVTVISRSTRFNPFPAAVKYYPCSLEHKHTLSQILPDADLVIHLASASTPSTSTLDPAFETLHNLMPTSRFLESFAEYSTANLIYLSSGGAIYGNNPNQTVDEQQPPRPRQSNQQINNQSNQQKNAAIHRNNHHAKRDDRIRTGVDARADTGVAARFVRRGIRIYPALPVGQVYFRVVVG